MGRWKLHMSIDSSVDHILSLDGGRMQKELANMYVPSLLARSEYAQSLFFYMTWLASFIYIT